MLGAYPSLKKSAKVFDSDISKVLSVFNRNGYRDYQRNREHRYLKCHIDQIQNLADPEIEIGISTF